MSSEESLEPADFDLPVDRERLNLESPWNRWALSKAGAGPDWRAVPDAPARREFPDAYFETHGGARPQSLEIGRPRSAPPRRYRPSPTDA